MSTMLSLFIVPVSPKELLGSTELEPANNAGELINRSAKIMIVFFIAFVIHDKDTLTFTHNKLVVS